MTAPNAEDDAAEFRIHVCAYCGFEYPARPELLPEELPERCPLCHRDEFGLRVSDNDQLACDRFMAANGAAIWRVTA